VTERPELVPTSLGPAGVIVGEPIGAPRGAALVLQGLGSPRSGFGRIWATTARGLADQGLLVLRVDYPGLGDSCRAAGGEETHRQFLREVVAWFRKQTGAARVGGVGTCYGARLALALAADGVLDGGLLLVTPWVGARRRRSGMRDLDRRARRRLGLAMPLDPDALADLRVASSRVPVRILVGERDTQERATLRAGSRRLGAPVAVDVEPGVRLHPWPTAAAHEAMAAWVVKKADHLRAAETVDV
jgi:dienelactone hydrolase